MTRNAKEYGITKIGAFGHGGMVMTNNARAPIAHPKVTTIKANVTIFLRKFVNRDEP
jgi:hypothetical protein